MVYVAEVSTAESARVEVPAGDDRRSSSAAGGGSAVRGTGTIREVHLDLSDPANRAAFDTSFVQIGTTATPNLLAFDPIRERLEADGLEVTLDVETFGDDFDARVAGGAGPQGDGARRAIDWGRNRTRETTTLRSITDRRSGQQIAVAVCGP